MADRRRLRLSTALRVTVVAGVIGIVLAGGFGYWIRDEVYTARYESADRTARQSVLDLVREADRVNVINLAPGDGPRYEIVDSGGWIASTQVSLRAYQGQGPILPLPVRGEGRSTEPGNSPVLSSKGPEPFATWATIGDYDASRDRCRPKVGAWEVCPDARRLDGRTFKAWRLVMPMNQIYPRGRVAADRTVAFSVLVDPFEAEDAVAELDRVLKLMLPAAVLLIMVAAYGATRTALRPVERMRVQAATISERSLHERIPIPPTGDVVARLGTTLNDTLGRLETAAARQRGFIADAAHELRSPIASLRAILEVASEHPDRADWPQVSRTAVEEIRRLQEIADDLLLVARLDAEAGVVVRKTVDLAELVRRQLARRVGEGPRLAFEAAESVVVAGDAGQLDRLVRNLVDNAMRHARSAVVVRIEEQAGRVSLHVDDDGAGIPVMDRERVFERFTRLDEARSRDAGGVGLGLAIAREIAQRHGGTLGAGAAPGGGARFTLVLREG